MINLAKYSAQFEQKFKKYRKSEYQHIVDIVENRLGNKEALNAISSAQFAKAMELLEPVIKMRNYKTQIPFPEDIRAVMLIVVAIKASKPQEKEISAQHKALFIKLITIDSFELPTVSAVFHFCYPEHFPIVDKYIAEACRFLKKDSKMRLAAPKLPYVNDAVISKFNRYRDFAKFLNLVRDKYEIPSYRELDMALMVLGSKEWTKQLKQKQAMNSTQAKRRD